MEFKWELFLLLFLSWIFGFIGGYGKAFVLLVCWIGLFIAFRLIPNDKIVKEIYDENK